MSPDLLAIAGAVGTSALLAVSKQFDSRVTSAPLFRKLQPAITLAGAFFAPFLAAHGVSSASLTTAPLATVGAIVGAELTALLTKRGT